MLDNTIRTAELSDIHEALVEKIEEDISQAPRAAVCPGCDATRTNVTDNGTMDMGEFSATVAFSITRLKKNAKYTKVSI